MEEGETIDDEVHIRIEVVRLLQNYVWNVVNGTTYLWVLSHLCTLIPINGKRPIYLPHVECR